jgi:predicted site-specific integrase-resolvase
MSEKLTTAQVAERLDVSHPTVKLWCRQGKFPNALLEEETRGPVWRIPVSDLTNFVKPTAGRPPKAKPAQSNGKKRGKK